MATPQHHASPAADRLRVLDPHALSGGQVVAALRADADTGLAEDEAARRLIAFGPNALREAPRPGLATMFLHQFEDFVIWLLIVAAIVAAVVGYIGDEGFADSIAIVAIVVLNALMGVIQERRAENALRALQAMAAPEAIVVRAGRRLSVPAEEVVPGDVVLLETGNYVPADMRLLEAVNLRIDEAPLTGESVPVSKEADSLAQPDAGMGDRRNMAHRGTVVSYGRGRGVVTTIGMGTAIGRIAELIQSYDREATPLQRRLDALGRTLGSITLVVCGIVFVVGLAQQTTLGTLLDDPGLYLSTFGDEILDLFMIAVSLAIAAVPEGLPAVVTIALAIGMQRMIRRHALIRRLPAVETLGSATTICSDKTGTLTQNEMMVVQVELEGRTVNVSGEGYAPTGELSLGGEVIDPATDADLGLLASAATLASDAIIEPAEEGAGWRLIGDPTEGALVAFAARAGRARDVLERQMPREAEIPFDSARKRMTTIHRATDARLLAVPELADHGVVAFVKGAPDVVLGLCDRNYCNGQAAVLSEAMRQRIADANDELASKALRVLAVAYRLLDEVPEDPTPEDVERDLVFVGLVGMIDPPRAEVGPAIAKARSAGIRTVMITGDYRNTAVAIARELDILRPEGEVITGTELSAMSDDELRARVAKTDVYARVSPRHKVRIVEALKDQGAIVAMTGDGVNDAPALKRAHIGVAMGITGTDVSRETADMVLTDDNYASIVAAVEEGRTIFNNIRKFVFYLLSCNIGEILLIFGAMIFGAAKLFGLPVQPPLLPIHLLWLNLVTDGLPALALGLEEAEPNVMDVPPRDPGESVLSRDLWPQIGIQAGVEAIATLVAFVWAYDGPETLALAQTVAFTTLVTAELFRAFTSRSQVRSIFEQGFLTNRWMIGATAASLALQLAVLYVPALQPIFNTVPLDLMAHWPVIVGLGILPAVAAELAKWWTRRRPPIGRAAEGTEPAGRAGEAGAPV